MEDNLFLVLGLTGSIGSGKTVVAKIFEQLGAKVLYADAIAKELMVTDAEVREEITNAFGTESYFSDRSLNKKYLADQIFSDSKKREQLNAIVHPATIEYIENAIQSEEESPTCKLFIVESALIFEAGIPEMFSYIIVVVSDESLCIERIHQRDGLPEEEIRKRFRSQLDPKKKVAQADFVVRNNGSLEEVQQKVTFLYQLLSKLEE